MIIDAHSHLGTNHNHFYSAEELTASLKEAEIDYSIVISIRREEYSNMDSLVTLSEKFPQIKVIGDVNFSMLDDNEIEKIKKYLTEKKIVGIKFYLGYENYYAMDKKLLPLYSFCQENDFPVVFHTGVLERGYRGLLKQSHPLNVDDVATQFPDLKIVIAHMGNPWLMDCGAVMAKNDNVYADMSGFFSEYQPIAQREIELFMSQMTDLRNFIGDFKKMLFGTDYPLYSQREYLEAVKLFPFTEEEKELVFWKNASTIFKLGL